ncbi:hypothetical protein MRB53_031849 [Persea americana]|uniref:Uncharacterized protein n=1 Tax=Persea americana TaxID=3435 RepID=A0ACC2KQL5_PERAE|nr:hypothetical protein MRB53_031849 [Persea americana]
MEKETHAKPSNKAWPKKKNGLLHLVQWVLQRHSARKPAAVSPASGKGQWKSLVGAMRPLHHDHLPHSPPISAGSSSRACSFYDRLPPHEYESDSSDGTSLYGSTEDLIGLCNANTESDGADEEKSEAEGPNAIDLKAEEFIAKFYQQMRLQHMNSIKN